MAWEISHTAEAWECFCRGLEAQTTEWLQEAIATCIADSSVDDWMDAYELALSQLQGAPHDALVCECVSWTERNSTCSNGGWDFYIDKSGFYSICLSDYEEE
jgi:hypothetical protein